MLTVYSAPRTRALRVVWLLEELGTPYELKTVTFRPTSDRFFIQDTPTGKIPTLVDGETVMGESGAIVEYLLEAHPDSGLGPLPGAAERGSFLQWVHFSESTAFPPIGVVVWLTLYRGGGDDAQLISDARARVATTLDFAERSLSTREHLLSSGFSAADIMLGFTLLAARSLDLLGDEHPASGRYLDRLLRRPALITAMQKVGGFE